MVANCSRLESGLFLSFRRIKNYHRNSFGQEKLSILSLMSMEHEILGDTFVTSQPFFNVI